MCRISTSLCLPIWMAIAIFWPLIKSSAQVAITEATSPLSTTVHSSFRSSRYPDQPLSTDKPPSVAPVETSSANSTRRKTDKYLFRIGLIVPRTAFLSQYKTYSQRIKDTFSHLLQLSHYRHQKSLPLNRSASSENLNNNNNHYGNSSQKFNSPNSSTNSNNQQQQHYDAKPSSSTCSSSSSSSTSLINMQQHSKRLPWSNLIFNQYFDIKIVDLVNLAAHSSAQDVIESMCQKLIEQNVSVIVYLENNQDHPVGSSTAAVSPVGSPLIGATSLAANSRTRNVAHKSRESPSFASEIGAPSYGGRDAITFSTTINKSIATDPLRQRSKDRVIAPAASNGIKELKTTDNNSRTEAPAQETTPRGLDIVGGMQPSSGSQAHFITHLAHSAGIPTIAWSVTATLAQRPKKQRTLHLAPTVAHEAEAMLAIMERYSWYSFSVVTSSLAGHEDFILALRQFMSAANSGESVGSAAAGINLAPSAAASSTSPSRAATNSSATTRMNHQQQQQQQQSHSGPELSKTFKLLDAITLKKSSSLAHIEEQLRQLTISESRVILLYSNKGEAIDILRVAKKLRLTKRSYAWIVAQSVIGPNEHERAPLEFHPGLLGIYFRSNHERLLDELSRAITIIAHGLERFVRESDMFASSPESNSMKQRPIDDRSGRFMGPPATSVDNSNKSTPSLISPANYPLNGLLGNHHDEHLRDSPLISAKSYNDLGIDTDSRTSELLELQQRASSRKELYLKKLLESHSKCQGQIDKFGEERGKLLYEYFRKSSATNVFDADGSLRDVELNVVNLDTERQWKKIGCFSGARLTIDDITWPEQAERPPSGTMEKFHLRAVFLEQPSFVNLAEPDTETGECKTNRAVRCRYKKIKLAGNSSSTSSSHSSGDNKPNTTAKPSDLEAGEEFEYKCCSGFCIDLMEKFAIDLKFSYDLYRVPDGFWGILENNTWNGLINEIIKGRADVIVSSIKINSDRQKAVEFTVPFLDTGISVLVAKQTGVIAKLAFLEPFDKLAWIMFICVGIPLAALSIFYFEWLSPNGFYARQGQIKGSRPAQADSGSRSTNYRQHHHHHHKFSFCRTLWLVITILFGSAAHIDSPKGYTARFMSNVWATFAVVFLAVYTANLAAFMITREEYLEFSGLNDGRLAYPFYRNPPLKFGTITGGNTHAVLSANKPNLYSYMRHFNRLSVEEGVEAVKSGQLDAFIYDSVILDYMASQDPECKLVNVGSWYSMTGYALAFPKNSRYFDKFNMKMLEYRKNGELDRLRRFWLQGLCKPGQTRHSISKPLDLSQFMSAFLLLGAGIIFSILILTLEHLYIIYLRDKLIRSPHREKLISWLYPFSLSLTDTLRLPGDDFFNHEPARHWRNKHGETGEENQYLWHDLKVVPAAANCANQRYGREQEPSSDQTLLGQLQKSICLEEEILKNVICYDKILSSIHVNYMATKSQFKLKLDRQTFENLISIEGCESIRLKALSYQLEESLQDLTKLVSVLKLKLNRRRQVHTPAVSGSFIPKKDTSEFKFVCQDNLGYDCKFRLLSSAQKLNPEAVSESNLCVADLNARQIRSFESRVAEPTQSTSNKQLVTSSPAISNLTRTCDTAPIQGCESSPLLNEAEMGQELQTRPSGLAAVRLQSRGYNSRPNSRLHSNAEPGREFHCTANYVRTSSMAALPSSSVAILGDYDHSHKPNVGAKLRTQSESLINECSEEDY